MAFTIVNSASSTVLTAATPLDLAVGIYYFKRCKVDSVSRKITIDSSPSANGSFAQDFGDCCWSISGGSILISGSSESDCKAAFQTLAANIKQQIGLTLSIPNENLSPFTNCVCTAFELMRRSDGRICVPNDDGMSFRSYVMMEFVQLSR